MATTLRTVGARFAWWHWLAAGSGAAVLAYGTLYSQRQRKKKEQEAKRVVVQRHSRILYFAGGFVTALGVAGCARFLSCYYYPSPDRVFSLVLPMIRAHREIRDCIGSQLQPGIFKAYAHTGGLQWGGISLRPPRLPVYYKQRSLQMMFQVHGDVSSGMVSLDVRRQSPFHSNFVFKSLAVDMPNGERLLLKGTSKKVVFQGYTRLR